MGEKQSDYASYLLRLWKADENGREVWLASLESTRTGRRESFADLGSLVRYLQDQFGGSIEQSSESASSTTRGS